METLRTVFPLENIQITSDIISQTELTGDIDNNTDE